MRHLFLSMFRRHQQPRTEGVEKNVVVLSDFRLFPTLVAIDLMLRDPEGLMLISEAYILFNDYGSGVRESRKRLTVWLLRLFFECEVIPELQAEGENHSSCAACLTSLVSEERDSGADCATNPERFSELNRLCAGAGRLLDEIEARGTESVYLFNGRLASTRKIADGSRASGSRRVAIYEWFTVSANSSIFAYRLADYPIHSHTEAGLRMAHRQRLEEIRELDGDVEAFIQSKLESRHALATQASPGEKSFVSLLLPGTPHEFKWATVGEDEIDGSPEELVQRFLDHPAFLEPFVIRMHPNTAGARDEADLLGRIRSLTGALEGEIIPSSSPVSTHRLIQSSSQVFVGGSSIALDAYLLGKVPIFLGANTYRHLIAALENSAPGDKRGSVRAAAVARRFFLEQKRAFLPILRPLVLLHALHWKAKRISRRRNKRDTT